MRRSRKRAPGAEGATTTHTLASLCLREEKGPTHLELMSKGENGRKQDQNAHGAGGTLLARKGIWISL